MISVARQLLLITILFSTSFSTLFPKDFLKIALTYQGRPTLCTLSNVLGDTPKTPLIESRYGFYWGTTMIYTHFFHPLFPKYLKDYLAVDLYNRIYLLTQDPFLNQPTQSFLLSFVHDLARIADAKKQRAVSKRKFKEKSKRMHGRFRMRNTEKATKVWAKVPLVFSQKTITLANEIHYDL